MESRRKPGHSHSARPDLLVLALSAAYRQAEGLATRLAHMVFDPMFFALHKLTLLVVWCKAMRIAHVQPLSSLLWRHGMVCYHSAWAWPGWGTR